MLVIDRPLRSSATYLRRLIQAFQKEFLAQREQISIREETKIQTAQRSSYDDQASPESNAPARALLSLYINYYTNSTLYQRPSSALF
jgi:hypothetical protein